GAGRAAERLGQSRGTARPAEQGREPLLARRPVHAGDERDPARCPRQGLLRGAASAREEEDAGPVCGDAQVPHGAVGVLRPQRALRLREALRRATSHEDLTRIGVSTGKYLRRSRNELYAAAPLALPGVSRL